MENVKFLLSRSYCRDFALERTFLGYPWISAATPHLGLAFFPLICRTFDTSERVEIYLVCCLLRYYASR